MNGVDHKGVPKYEVVVSNLRVPVGKPVYIGASISSRPLSKGSEFGEVTFYVKDLSDPKATLAAATIRHSVVGKLNDSLFPVVVGGRRQIGHLWDGQVSRLTLSRANCRKNNFLFTSHPLLQNESSIGNFPEQLGKRPL